jgi:hypothetical protein
MRALVIYTSERPVDVIMLPEDTSVLQLEAQTERLDAAGVDYEVLPISRNASVTELAADIGRYAYQEPDSTPDEVCDECGEGPDGVLSLLHSDSCSCYPANCA